MAPGTNPTPKIRPRPFRKEGLLTQGCCWPKQPAGSRAKLLRLMLTAHAPHARRLSKQVRWSPRTDRNKQQAAHNFQATAQDAPARYCQPPLRLSSLPREWPMVQCAFSHKQVNKHARTVIWTWLNLGFVAPKIPDLVNTEYVGSANSLQCTCSSTHNALSLPSTPSPVCRPLLAVRACCTCRKTCCRNERALADPE